MILKDILSDTGTVFEFEDQPQVQYLVTKLNIQYDDFLDIRKGIMTRNNSETEIWFTWTSENGQDVIIPKLKEKYLSLLNKSIVVIH